MSMMIRTAKIEDSSALAALAHELGYPSSQEKIAEILTSVQKHEQQQIFIAEIDQSIVGYIHLVCVKPTELDVDQHVEIAALNVHQNFRQQGVGHGLIEYTFDWSKNKRQNQVRIRANIIEERAYGFFIQNGFRHLSGQEIFLKSLEV